MIKASGGTKDGVPLLLLGLSRPDVERLLVGKSILFRADEVDPRLAPMHVVIMGGETEDAIVAELRKDGAPEV